MSGSPGFKRLWTTRRRSYRGMLFVTLCGLAWPCVLLATTSSIPDPKLGSRTVETFTLMLSGSTCGPILSPSELEASLVLKDIAGAQEHFRALSKATGGPGHFANSLNDLRPFLDPQLLERVDRDYRVSVGNALLHPSHGWQAVANPRRRWQRLKAFSVNCRKVVYWSEESWIPLDCMEGTIRAKVQRLAPSVLPLPRDVGFPGCNEDAHIHTLPCPQFMQKQHPSPTHGLACVHVTGFEPTWGFEQADHCTHAFVYCYPEETFDLTILDGLLGDE